MMLINIMPMMAVRKMAMIMNSIMATITKSITKNDDNSDEK